MAPRKKSSKPVRKGKVVPPTENVASIRAAAQKARKLKAPVRLHPDTVEFLLVRGEPKFGSVPLTGPCSKTAEPLPLFDGVSK